MKNPDLPSTTVRTTAMKTALLASAFLLPLASAAEGMVREAVLGPAPFSADGAETAAFSVLRPGAAKAVVRVAWTEEGLSVNAEGAGAFALTTLAADGAAKTARGRLGEKMLLPWRDLTANGQPPAAPVKAIWDLAWESETPPQGETADQKNAAKPGNVSMSVLCAEPRFRANPHLPHSGQWGWLVFGEAGATAAKATDDGLVRDFDQLAAPRGVATIDGDLGEWTGAAFSRFALLPAALGDRYAGEVAARFDDAALYLALRMAKPQGAPANSAFFESRAGYAGGDALQIRLADGEGKSESFCAWLDSSTGKPALTCDNKVLPTDAVFAAGGALAFGKWPGGYTMEIKLPWAATGMKAPQDGEKRRATLQPWWGPSGHAITVVTELALAARPVQALALDLPREGRLAAGVFAADGSLVRQLCAGRYLPKGRATLTWDGRDQKGEVAPAGKYALRGVLTDELRETYRFSIMNPSTPAWPTADGKGDWLSDEAPPQGVATDGERVFIAAPGAEKGTTILCLGPNDRRAWGFATGTGFYPRCVSLSCAGGKLYALFSGPINSTGKKTPYDGKNAVGRAVVMCFDAQTGKLADFSARSPRVELPDRWEYREKASGIWRLAADKAFAPATYIGQPRYFCEGVGEPDNAIGLAALDGLLAVAKHQEDRIDFYDGATLAKRGSVAVAAPAGLCRVDGRAFLAISGKKVLRVELDPEALKNNEIAATSRPVVENGLAAPVAVTLDKDGTIYVSDWGDAMCAKKFAADGTPQGEIGKRGGRAWIGAFDAGAMLLPHGLAVRNGALYVAEADMLPKRVSKWNVATSAYERDWVGPSQYAGGTWLWLDPKDDAIVHVDGCAVKVDWDSGAWQVQGTELRRMDAAQPFAFDGASCMASGARVIRRGDAVFVALSRYRGNTVFYRADGDRLVPCAAVGSSTAATTGDGSAIYAFDSDIGQHLYHGLNPDWLKGHPIANWVWSDLDGNGLAEANEVQFADAAAHRAAPKPGQKPLWYSEWGRVPGPDGTLALAAHTADEIIYSRLTPRTWTAHGPVFDLADEKPFFREKRSSKDGVNGTYIDDGGNVYCAGRYGGNRAGGTPYALRAFAPDGSPRWTVATPKSREELALSLSNLCAEWNVPGIGRVLGGWNWWWTFRPYLVTDDGLVLATAFEETNDGPRAIWGESHQFFVERRGKRYLVNGANQQAHFIELEGLDNAVRLEAAFSVTEADAARAAASADATLAAPKPPKPRIIVPWRDAPPAIDGDLGEWQDAPNVALDGGKGRGARIFLARDAANLYVAADVDDPTPMLQNGEDWQTLFITGDCVDVMLAGADAKRRNPRECVAGDRRLQFSLFAGKPVAVLFEPVTEPRAKTPVPMMATTIDSVRRLESAQVALRRRDDGTGYALEAAAPLAEIGALPTRGDVGVIFSGAIGGRELRLYHYNRDTGMTDDLTTEATLQPHEWGPLAVAAAPSLFAGPWKETRKTGAAQASVATEGRVSVAAPKGATRLTPANVDATRPFTVTGGAKLNLRYVFRANDLQVGTEQRKKAGLGYAEAHLALVFYDASGKPCGRVPLAKFAIPQRDWREVRGIYGGGSSAPKEIVAPPEAARGILSLKFTCCEPTLAPELFIDGMELTNDKKGE